MTSVIPQEELRGVARIKQKSHNGQEGGKVQTQATACDESRSFLAFSRENLSISTSDLEQGFANGKPGPGRRSCSRRALLACAALALGLVCAALELWSLRRGLANTRDLEALRRDVEDLKQRLHERDLLEDIKAFEEQLYGEDASEEELEAASSDYDSGYEEATAAPEERPPSTASPCTAKDLETLLGMLRRAEEQRLHQRSTPPAVPTHR